MSVVEMRMSGNKRKIEQKLKKFLGGGTSNQVKEMDLLVKEEYDTLFHFLLLAKSSSNP